MTGCLSVSHPSHSRPVSRRCWNIVSSCDDIKYRAPSTVCSWARSINPDLEWQECLADWCWHYACSMSRVIFTQTKGLVHQHHVLWYVSTLVLYCTVLYYSVLYCTELYCTVLYYISLYCTVPYCTVLYCTISYTVFHWTVLYRALGSEDSMTAVSQFPILPLSSRVQ